MPVNAKLTVEDVKRIRRIATVREMLRKQIRKSSGRAALAKQFNCSVTTIDRIIQGDYRRNRSTRASQIADSVLHRVAQGKYLLSYVTATMSNDALATELGVHVNSILNVTRYQWYRHVR